MPRKIRNTFSGRQEEVWVTENDGLFGAYDLKEWYQGLPHDIKNKIVEIQSSISGSMMPAWDKSKLVTGPFEIHRSLIERYAWTYSDVPPLLATIFEWAVKRDDEVAQLVLNKWLALAFKSSSSGAKLLAFTAAIEYHWNRGYTNAKDIRERGLYNHDLIKVERLSIEAADLLIKKQLTSDLSVLVPLDRLFLLYKLTRNKVAFQSLINELEQSGYGGLPVIVSYKNEFSKI